MFLCVQQHDWPYSAAQKIKKLSETPGTVPIVAKLCMIDSKNRKIASYVAPRLFLMEIYGNFNGEMALF